MIEEFGIEDNFFARFMKTTLDYSIQSLIATISHEAGHHMIAEKFNLNPYIKIDPFLHIFYHGGSCGSEFAGSPEQSAQVSAGGLNQNILNAGHIWQEIQTRTHDTFEDMNYAINQLLPLCYNWRGKFVNKKGDDYKHYIEHMNKTDLEINRLQLGWHQSIISLANTQIYHSLYSLIDYLATGKKEHEPLTIKIGETEITPPLFEYFLTNKGEFVNSKTIINPLGKNPIIIEYGTDLDELQTRTNLNTHRFGIKILNINIKDALISPFVYINLDNKFNPKGIYLGLEFEKEIIKNLTLKARIGYSENDVIHNIVRGEENGFGFNIGISSNILN